MQVTRIPSEAMKILKKSFVSRARLFQGALFAFLLAGFVVQSEAQVTNITKSLSGHISNLGFDPNAGLDYWTVSGVDQLSQETFYFNLGSGVTELNSSMFTSEAVSRVGSSYNQLNVWYNLGSGFTANFNYVLGISGNTYSLTPTIYINNNNDPSSSANIIFYQYSDFVLGNVSGSQNVQMSILSNPSQYQAYQTGEGASLQDLLQPIGGATTEMQADNGGAPFGPLNGSPNPLNDITLTASGNAVFAYEWDVTGLQGGSSFTISQTQTITVPEPSSVALVSAGMLAVALVCRRRRN